MNRETPESKISKNNSCWMLGAISTWIPTEIILAEGELIMKRKHVSEVLNILTKTRE